MTDERLRLESPVFPIIVTVTLLAECQPIDGAVYIFPFTGEDMAVTGLRRPSIEEGNPWKQPVEPPA